MNAFTRIDTSKLFPPFLAKLEQLVVACEARGARYIATSGLRSYEEQNALYAQGRTKPGQIVTKAQGGFSQHQFGVAADFVADKDLAKDGLQPDWAEKAYEVLAEEAEKLGLEAGLHWKSFHDAPHVQLPLDKHQIALRNLREVYLHGGQPAVLAFLAGFTW